MKVAQLCPTLCNPMDYIVHGILQARILEWVAIPFFPHSSVGKESAYNTGDPGLIPGSGRSAGEGIGYCSSILGLPWWLSWYRIHLQCRRPRFDPWVGKIPWQRVYVNPLQYPGLENSMDCIVHGVTKSRTRLSDFHFGGLEICNYI